MAEGNAMSLTYEIAHLTRHGSVLVNIWVLLVACCRGVGFELNGFFFFLEIRKIDRETIAPPFFKWGHLLFSEHLLRSSFRRHDEK